MNMVATARHICDRVFGEFGYTSHQYPNPIGMVVSEVESLAWAALNSDPHYDWMEIGSFAGGSATTLCLARRELNAGPRVISVDVGFHHEQFDATIKKGGFEDISHKIQCDSLDLEDHYDGNPLSFALVDGWHSFKAALQDIILVDKWLIPGGYMAIHDTPARVAFDDVYFAGEKRPDYDLRLRYQEAVDNYDKWMSEALPPKPGAHQIYKITPAIAWFLKHHGGYDIVYSNTLQPRVDSALCILRKHR